MTTMTPTRRRAKVAPATETNSAQPVDLGVITRGALRWRRFRRFMFYLAFALLGLVLLAVAGVHAELVQGQQEVDQLSVEIRQMRDQRAALQRQVDEASSPVAIIGRAGQLGMVRAQDPVYLTVVEPTEAP